MKYITAAIISIFLFNFCVSSARFASKGTSRASSMVSDGEVMVGYASYYAKKFHGKKTASGEIFDMHGYTAAHRSLPFGTVIMVTNMENKRKVKVRINDRGPFVKGRILDLSLQAAKDIGLIKTGVAKVEIKILKTGSDE